MSMDFHSSFLAHLRNKHMSYKTTFLQTPTLR